MAALWRELPDRFALPFETYRLASLVPVSGHSSVRSHTERLNPRKGRYLLVRWRMLRAANSSRCPVQRFGSA